MLRLYDILQQRSHRELQVVAGAYGIPFSRKPPKAEGLDALYAELQTGWIKRAFHTLRASEIAALQTLQAAQGRMPLYPFMARFGEIRLYKPWRSDAPLHPWRRPASAAERLYQLAFIQMVDQQIVLAAEVLDLLPPLPEAAPIRATSPRREQGRVVLLRDFAIFLGALQYAPIVPQWRRWLPPSALKAINRQFVHPEDMRTVRSELQTGRLRFLHYLATEAGVVSVQNGTFQPTRLAWEWLDLPAADGWKFLGDVIAPESPLWQQFRLPAVSWQLWKATWQALHELQPDHTYLIQDFIAALQPYLPLEQELERSVGLLLQTVLTWLGMVIVSEDAFYLTSAIFPALQGATITVEARALQVSLPPHPNLPALVDALAWAEINQGRLTLDEQAVRRAHEQGDPAPQILQVLARLQAASLAPEVVAQVRQWAQQVQRLQLRHLAVLTASDPDLLSQIRADWRLRPLLAEALSSHHLVVQGTQVDALLKRLGRRGYTVTTLNRQSEGAGALTPDMAEYLWLAVRTYQLLGALVPQPMRIPGAVRHWLTAQLPTGGADGLEQAAQQLQDQLKQRLQGRTIAAGGVAQTDPDGIREAVHQAQTTKGRLRIEYYSPHYGETTVRTIEPVLRYERNQVEYLEAWCDRDEAVRTFRMDRILRIVDDYEIRDG